MASHDDIGDDELRRRVIYALLRPAVRIAGAFGIELAELAELVQTAYFQELRGRGLTLEEAAGRLGVSRRTAARLSRQLKERFVVSDIEHNLPRRIEFMVAAEPMSATRVAQVLSGVPADDVRSAIEVLIREGRVEERPGRTPTLHASAPVRQLPRDSWVRRVGGLASFAENLSDAAFGRFFSDNGRAFARTLSFRMPRGGAARLEAVYAEHVLPAVVALDTEGEGEPMQLSVCWAPYDLIHTNERGGA